MRIVNRAESRIQPNGKPVVRWNCLCLRCGTMKVVDGTSLKSGLTKSCGCYRTEVVTRVNTKHGDYKTSLYNAFNLMWQRCTNANLPAWKNYGGRGIQVCDRWKEYDNFKADMGMLHRPGLTLDRINNDGNYEPGNCRWATRKEQQRNRRINHLLTIGSETLCAGEWAGRAGIDTHIVLSRLRRKWTPFEAVWGRATS